jgi:hypothetical protein
MTSTQEVSHPALPPASGAWRVGDHPGDRRFVDVGEVDLG